jgi:hypothetical protein
MQSKRPWREVKIQSVIEQRVVLVITPVNH